MNSCYRCIKNMNQKYDIYRIEAQIKPNGTIRNNDLEFFLDFLQPTNK